MFSDGTVTGADWECKTIQYGPVDPEGCLFNYAALMEDYYFYPPECKYNTNDTFVGTTCTVRYSNISDNFTEYICPSELDWSVYSDDGEDATFIWQENLNFDNWIVCRYSYEAEESTSKAGYSYGMDVGATALSVVVSFFVATL